MFYRPRPICNMYINFIWSLCTLLFLFNIGIVSIAHIYCPCDPGKDICNESVQRFSVSLTLNYHLAMLKPWPISRLLWEDPMFVGKLYCKFSSTTAILRTARVCVALFFGRGRTRKVSAYNNLSWRMDYSF